MCTCRLHTNKHINIKLLDGLLLSNCFVFVVWRRNCFHFFFFCFDAVCFAMNIERKYGKMEETVNMNKAEFWNYKFCYHKQTFCILLKMNVVSCVVSFLFVSSASAHDGKFQTWMSSKLELQYPLSFTGMVALYMVLCGLKCSFLCFCSLCSAEDSHLK